MDTHRLIEKNGAPVTVVSGGSRATYTITGMTEGFDELQCGTYVTMDRRYAEVVPGFVIALSVLVTVISRAQPSTAMLDLGIKGAGDEFGPPRIKGHPDIEVPYFISEKHIVIQKVPDWRVGQTIELISSHACTRCNLYRRMHVHENGHVVDIWPIEGSGKLA